MRPLGAALQRRPLGSQPPGSRPARTCSVACTCSLITRTARIASRTGHLSNRASAELARDVVHRDLAHVVLAHLSEQCNDHGIAHRAAAAELRRTRFRGALSVAMQHGVVGPFLPRAGRGAPEAQYALAL